MVFSVMIPGTDGPISAVVGAPVYQWRPMLRTSIPYVNFKLPDKRVLTASTLFLLMSVTKQRDLGELELGELECT